MDAQLITTLAIVSAIFILALIFLLIRRTVAAHITGFSWQRKVELEQYIWVEESSYWGYPEGSRNQHSTTETYFTYEVTSYNTTTTHNPDGTTSTTTEPVYSMVPHSRTVYKYEIQRWCKSRDVIAEEDSRNPYWPHYTLSTQPQERVRTTKEKYLVHFQTEKGKQYRRKLPESEWAALDDHMPYRLRVTLYGKVTRFEPHPTQAMMMQQQAQ